MKHIYLFTIIIFFILSTKSTAIAQKLTFTSDEINELMQIKPLTPLVKPLICITDVPINIQNNKYLNSKAVEILEVPMILTAISLATIPFKDRFFNIRSTYAQNFHKSYDDYTQYLPAAVMLGVKAFGVEGRSSWGRMLTSDAFSIVTMIVLVNGIKYTAAVKRPDSGALNSYPSGHTATAFMTATMLHKEYGLVNKWYSIGAYSAATLTGITRVLNNRHWLSDVFFGAAIGIVSTELGYYFSDLIFKDKGLNQLDEKGFIWYGEEYCPSFISLYTAMSVLPGSFNGNDGTDINLKNSSRFGLEGAWYMNPNIGFGGQATVSTADVQTENNKMGMISGLVGSFFSYPISDRWRIGSKALIGADFIKQPMYEITNFKDYVATIATGISISYFTDRNFGFKIFADYRHHFEFVKGAGLNELNFGVSIELLFGRPKY